MFVRTEVRTRSGMRVTVAALLAATAPAAFGADSPTAGRTMFEGNSIQPCTACHVNVENRRAAIDPGGDLDFELVYATFLNAIARVTEMNKFGALTMQQQRDIAAYIADVPKARPNLVDFSASNTSIETSPVTITFSNAVTAPSAITLVAVGIAGANPTDFVIKTNTCSNNSSLGASGTCSVDAAFRTQTSSAKSALLSIQYSQGGTFTTRTAQLTGTVVGQTPLPTAATPSGGGGAMGLAWGSLLALAMGLRRRLEGVR